MDLGTFPFAGKREDELRVSFGGGFDTGVCRLGHDGAQGARIGCVAKAPDVFDLFLREGEGFLYVDEGG